MRFRLHRRLRVLECGAAFLTLLILAFAAAGCVKLTYDKLKLGEPPSKYERILPAAQSRRTSVGLCQLKKSSGGKTEALLLVLSDDRRLAGKIRIRRVRTDAGFFSREEYELQGTMDPALYGAAQTGPADVLRSLLRSLVDYRGEKLAVEAHRLVAAGLLRILEQWPEAADLGLSPDLAADLAEIAPRSGKSRTDVATNGVIRFEYR